MPDRLDNPGQTPPVRWVDRLEGGVLVLDAEKLFAGGREVKLMYGKEEYRLRITRNSKLILTK